MKHPHQKIAAAAFVGILLVAGIWAMNEGMDRQEIVECNTWDAQSREYTQFFLAKWQDAQCRAHGIVINAPIR